MTLHDAMLMLESSGDTIRADGPLHRQMTALAQNYIYETLRINLETGGR